MFDSVIGFTASVSLKPEAYKALIHSQQRVVIRFPQLGFASMRIGETHIQLWGHGDLSSRLHRMNDGSLLALIGSPHGCVCWRDVEAALLDAGNPQDFSPPWDGRFNLLMIAPDGLSWTMWNDWIGSIPVFYALQGRARVASTLEPVVAATANLTPNDIYLPGLASLLINGHFLGDWTLFRGMKVAPPDSVAIWSERSFRYKQLWTVAPNQSRWEAGWDDLVDEMHELSRQAIVDVLKTQPDWTLPLSSGLDSRLIAAVGAEVGANLYAYAWGGPQTTDVVYSRQIARTLGLPWKHIVLPEGFLVEQTKLWADWFGSSMHFHGMYLMSFLDEIADMPAGPLISGLLGEVLSGDYASERSRVHASNKSCQLFDDWYSHWSEDQIRTLVRFPMEDVLAETALEIRRQIEAVPGALYQKLLYLELWSRQRLFTSFQATLSDYWRGVATPYVNRAYARFCMSLPLAALDDRRLLADVYRRYYGRLAVIPGTYARQPFTLTGRYLLKERLANTLPSPLAVGPLRGFQDVQLRMDMVSVQAYGKDALWPVFEAWAELAEWIRVEQLEAAFQAILHSREDIRPLRQLQSAQCLAFRLLDSK